MMNAKLLFAAPIALALAVPAPNAMAVEPGNLVSRSQAVTTSDLDLAREADVARLKRRIAYAAQIVCGPADSHDLAGLARFDTCRKAAIDSAAPRLQAAVAAAKQSVKLALDVSAQPETRRPQ